ncbi:MAG: MFS transporter [Candidatus Cohnella colombiensis]|uniref:MFS transporter n=1 Tax=Candidatus Cohnella colombiensis TaxID=3121368 RepID=A0AA95JH24_9BACL|nr:MAG: MFS transporter [Cohnella sp.]
MNSNKLWNRNFIMLCLSSFFVFINFYSLMATLPTYITDHLSGTQKQVGWAITSFMVAAVLFRPIAGRLVDTIGRKKIVVPALIVFALSTLLYFSITSFILLLLLRFIHGMSFGMATTGNGTIASDLIPKDRKGEGLGYYTLSMNLAMVIGPFVGLLLTEHWNFKVLLMVLSVTTILSLVFGANIKLTKTVPDASHLTTKQLQPAQGWRKYIEPSALPISISAMLLALAYSGILTYVAGYAKHLGLGTVASYFFVVYAIMIIFSRPITGKLFDRWGEHRIIYPSLILYVIGLICLSQANSPFMLLLSAALVGLGMGTLTPSLQTIAIRHAPPHRIGLATATFFLLFDTGFGIGSITLGRISSTFDERTMYFISALIVVVGALLYYVLHHRKQLQSHKSATQ